MDWKNNLKPKSKTQEFYEKATSNGVIIACQKCKEPFWSVAVDPVTKKTETKSFRKDWVYHDVWADLKPHSMKPCPHCGTVDWMRVIRAGDKLFPRPYILGNL